MRKAPRLLVTMVSLLALAVLSAGCSRRTDDSPSPERPTSAARGAAYRPDPAAAKQARPFATAANGLGFSIINALGQDRPDGNLLVSPISLQLALAMTYNGAAGATAEEMAETMALGGQPLDEVNRAAASLLKQFAAPGQGCELLLANGLFCGQTTSFLPGFLQASKTSYRAEVRSLDLRASGAADTINGWAEDKTRGMIPQIVTPDMLAQAEIVLANALYFKGEWEKPFPAHGTQDAPFHLPGGAVKTVRMMERGDVEEHILTEELEAARMPYKQGALRMVVLLPREGSSPAALLRTMTAERWQALMEQDWTAHGTLLLPRFKADSDERLNEPLKSLGMSLAFTWPGADFSKMADPASTPQGLFISWVVQKCVVEVDEVGTRAAAVTHAGATSGPPGPTRREEPFRMVVDRPFVFVIEHVPTGAILMVGSVSDPQ